MPAKKLTKDDKLSRIFKSRRAELGLTQLVVAKHYGVKQSSVSTWENQSGRMSVDWFIDYCKYLKIPKDKVLEMIWGGD